MIRENRPFTAKHAVDSTVKFPPKRFKLFVPRGNRPKNSDKRNELARTPDEDVKAVSIKVFVRWHGLTPACCYRNPRRPLPLRVTPAFEDCQSVVRKLTVPELAKVNAAGSLITLLSALLSGHWHDLLISEGLTFAASLGPLVCLFMTGMLVATFWESKRTHFVSLLIGMACGGLSFLSWVVLNRKSS